MTTRQRLLLGTSVLAACVCWACSNAPAQSGQQRLVRLAELEIDPAHLDSYKAALREEIEASIRLEPGVLTLFAVAVKEHPNQIRIFETYTDIAAWQAHLQTAHFRKYKTGTQHMIRSLTLIETDPILLGAKAK